MIIPDKKKMATMIVAQLHGGHEEAPEEAEEDSPYEALAGDVLRAVKSGSVAELADALRAFLAACEGDGEEGEGES